MNNSKFLGVSIVIAAVIVASALCYHAAKTNHRGREEGGNPSPRTKGVEGIGRYQFQPSNPPGVIWVIDTVTGKVTSQNR